MTLFLKYLEGKRLGSHAHRKPVLSRVKQKGGHCSVAGGEDGGQGCRRRHSGRRRKKKQGRAGVEKKKNLDALLIRKVVFFLVLGEEERFPGRDWERGISQREK